MHHVGRGLCMWARDNLQWLALLTHRLMCFHNSHAQIGDDFIIKQSVSGIQYRFHADTYLLFF